jgi:glycosyltransferase involved in cell wall biosynthesis
MTTSHLSEQPSIIFLGGIFLPSQHDTILTNSRGVVQNAADALQKAFLRGFAVHVGDKVQAVNLPFVGSYPQTYDTVWFPACEDTLPSGIKVQGEGFLNLRFIRWLSRFASSFRGLRRACKNAKAPVVVVYSAHLPFLAAARLMRIVRSDVFLCVIVPDLPEFMGVGGRLYTTVKAIESFLFGKIVRGFDSFIFLTDAMGERMGIPVEKRMVVEGIYDPQDDPPSTEAVSEGDHIFTILYTGTLAARYGIGDLLQAFNDLGAPEAQLWICGDGDTRPVIESLAKCEPRLKYYGQVARVRAQELQRKASVLVNPRRPEGEFTRYSFPSKTMEYLASGKPVIMHGLPGIPPEYVEHLTIPATPDAAGLAQALCKVSAISSEDRATRGELARAFILASKSPEAQILRVLEHWARQKSPPTDLDRLGPK